MIYFGVASQRVDEVIEFYPTRDEADAALRKLLAEAPQLRADAFVVEVEFPTPSAN
jgi:hypothetical protein